jgi:hypothetical protein
VTVRFASRFIKHSVGQAIEAFLAEYGWTTDRPPFGTDRVVVEHRAPETKDLRPLAGNVVFISFGGDDDVRPRQMGGGMLRQGYVVFVDVVGTDESIADALAGDLKDRLTGLFGGTRYLRPTDPSTGRELPGYLGEFTDVVRDQPSGERRNWYSISCTLEMDFPATDD